MNKKRNGEESKKKKRLELENKGKENEVIKKEERKHDRNRYLHR